MWRILDLKVKRYQKSNNKGTSKFRIKNYEKISNVIFTGEAINQFYFPILVPVGVIGNILSFLVSTFETGSDELQFPQKCKHNGFSIWGKTIWSVYFIRVSHDKQI